MFRFDAWANDECRYEFFTLWFTDTTLYTDFLTFDINLIFDIMLISFFTFFSLSVMCVCVCVYLCLCILYDSHVAFVFTHFLSLLCDSLLKSRRKRKKRSYLHRQIHKTPIWHQFHAYRIFGLAFAFDIFAKKKIRPCVFFYANKFFSLSRNLFADCVFFFTRTTRTRTYQQE